VSDSQDQASALPPERVLRLLSEGQIEIEGLIPYELSTLAVYKPQRGERPLWDFAYGSLGMREVAAYLVSEALGWGFVPPTVLRRGPRGLGSVQLYVHALDDAHFFAIQDDPGYREDLRRLAAFDAVVNNADRKAGHCLVDRQGHLWAIDNSLTFHLEPKLRTVIWDFAGQPLPEPVLAGQQLLSQEEMAALRHRLERFIHAGRFPKPGPGRSVPWPLV